MLAECLLKRRCACLLVLLAIRCVSDVPAQDDVPPASAIDEPDVAKLLHPFFLQQASDYQFAMADDETQPFKLVRQPVMTWQGDKSWYGDLFVWTHKGRPEVIGCVGSWRISGERRGVFHEFHSLSTKPLATVQIGPRYSWSSRTSGIKLQPVPDAPLPATTKRLRTLQMRALARDFSALLKSGKGRQVLRMQAPLYSYTTETGEDGAIFPFVWTVGTDPEVLLVLETRQTEDGTRWCFAPARFTWREVWLQHEDKEVWHATQYREQMQTKKLKESYATIEVKPVSLTELGQQATDQTPSSTVEDKP